MSILASRQINWMWAKPGVSLRSIARDSRIPYTTLWRTARLDAPLPSQYQPALRNAYQRAAYKSLRQVGMSSGQATRFSWYNPESVDEYLSRMDNLVSFYSTGAMKKKLAALDYTPSMEEVESIVEDLTSRIREGLSKSRKPFEDWERGIT